MIRIISVIENVCKKLGVNYVSPQHNLILERNEDVQLLANICAQLKEIEGQLEEIENKYPELRNIIEIDLGALDKIDHHLVIEANKIIRRTKNEL